MDPMKSKYAVFIVALFANAASAHAEVVTTWGPTDGVGAVPIANGIVLLDVRASSTFPGISVAAPTINLVAGATDWLEIGVGSALQIRGLGAGAPSFSQDAIYPWAKAALPLSSDTVKTAIAAGASIPGYASAADTIPGLTAIVDLSGSPLSSSFNLGYGRGLNGNTNIVAANLNFTGPPGAITYYEEQFVTYPINLYAYGGIRVAAIIPLSAKTTFDVSFAALFQNSPTGPQWSYSPGLGATLAF
jgi:hypothetical protein